MFYVGNLKNVNFYKLKNHRKLSGYLIYAAPCNLAALFISGLLCHSFWHLWSIVPCYSYYFQKSWWSVWFSWPLLRCWCPSCILPRETTLIKTSVCNVRKSMSLISIASVYHVDVQKQNNQAIPIGLRAKLKSGILLIPWNDIFSSIFPVIFKGLTYNCKPSWYLWFMESLATILISLTHSESVYQIDIQQRTYCDISIRFGYHVYICVTPTTEEHIDLSEVSCHHW